MPNDCRRRQYASRQRKRACPTAQRITSEGGTTEAGLNTLAAYQFEEAVVDCVKTATKRAAELNEMFFSKHV
ncbi:hypothetical protein BsIDN1_41300 [Bacillus safensis]|uniref:Pyrroline-5-carboxylate reductase dimerisation domain-containing protein n=1 Tax=Bacillus safensis TaxID=561879 RepID=A0A5S9MD57_BACIA|nr:hypothetical protein BsIDN1_41300 [Bacillus safensis]